MRTAAKSLILLAAPQAVIHADLTRVIQDSPTNTPFCTPLFSWPDSHDLASCGTLSARDGRLRECSENRLKEHSKLLDHLRQISGCLSESGTFQERPPLRLLARIVAELRR